MSFKLTRVSGAQNTFFLVNALEAEIAKQFRLLSKNEKQQFARQVCLGFDGFSTDGLIFIYPRDQYDFEWDFYNSDGSFAEMCGNAARCATFFYYKKVKDQSKIRFFTGAGEIIGTVLEENKVKVQMTAISESQRLNVLGKEGLFVNTGVPHFVLNEKPNEDLAKKLRQVSDFGAGGANITFVHVLGPQKIEAVTFERGVENYTRACGTGAVAAAVFLQKQGNQQETFVSMPGGELIVDNVQEGQRPFLTGPVRIEFDMINFEEKFYDKGE